MKAKCLWCNDIIESKDGVPDTCQCGRSFLDVGPDHYRGGGYLKYIKDEAPQEDIDANPALTQNPGY